jgi:signal transduction histidine kinase
MNLRFIGRVPWFELSTLLIVVTIGWAAWELNRLSVGQGQPQNGEELKRDAVAASLQDRMGRDFRQTWERYVLSNSNAVQTLRDAKDPHKLPGAYRSVADRLQTELPKIHRYLESYAKQTNWNNQVQWEKRIQELKDWLWTQQLQSEQDRLVAQSQELAARGSNTLSLDLGSFYREAERRLTNYVHKGKYVCTLARFFRTNAPPSGAGAATQPTNLQAQSLPVDSAILRDAQAEAQIQLQGLFELAGQARVAASIVDAHPLILPEPLEKVEREFALAGNEALKLAFLSERTNLSSQLNAFLGRLQPVFYVLLAAAFGLSLFLISAIYRRVVERLNFRLYESTTENKLAHLGHLSAWLAHEIKQPLTAINAWLWTLQKRVKKEMPEHMGTEAIRKEINRLDQIVKDFLRFTQPAAPKLVHMKAEPILREVLELVGPQLEHRGIRLSLDSRVDASFAADPQQLKQVLINLITNAAESIENVGTITVRTRRDYAPLNGRAADAILIEVEDTGSGIAPDVQERLFDPFFSTKEEGTGLGLPISRKIIDAHGGALEFKTALDEGTTFRIVLPLAREAKVKV